MCKNRNHQYIIRVSCLVLVLGLVFGSCTKSFNSMNTDPTKINNVGPSSYPYMFSYALQSATLNSSYFEVGEGALASTYSQFFAADFMTDQYQIISGWNNYFWLPPYTMAAPQLKTIIAGTDPASAQNAIANIWWVWMFHRVTDYWGPVPYTQAANGQRNVAYTPQDSIYYDFFKKLDAAVKVLNNHKGEKPWGTLDLVYGSKADPVSAWIKFANTLRLRLALRISLVNPSVAKTQAEAAVASGVMTDLSTDAYMMKSGKVYLEYNQLSVIGGWDDLRMSASMVSILKGYNDPRMQIFFQPATSTGLYAGIRNGLTSAQKTLQVNSYGYNSNIGTRWITRANGAWVNNYAVPQDIMHAAEAYFLRAEGALNGWNMGDNAQNLYQQGIQYSMNQWGITDGTVINNYITSAAVPIPPQDGLNSPAVNNYPIAWSADPLMQRKQVAQQKWLALFPDGVEGWAEVRRTDLPQLYPVVNSVNPDLPVGTTIKRIPFLDAEIQNNAAAVTQAVTMLGGPDNAATRLWWDVQ